MSKYRDKIVQLRKCGRSYQQIEEELGCARSTISYHCQKAGLEDIGLDGQREEVPDETKNRIRKLYKTHTISEVNKMVDVSKSTILKYATPKSEVGKTSKSTVRCEYGCGNTANHILNNGKLCCSENYQSCPEVRRKNSRGGSSVSQK